MLRISTPAIALLALLVPAGASSQTFGRAVFHLVDEKGAPVADAKVVVDCDQGHHQERKSNKKGRVSMAFADATASCTFVIEKEGYGTQRIESGLIVGGVLTEEIVLRAPNATAEPTEAGKVVSYTPAENAFNEGADALRHGDLETARAKFEEALERDSDLVEAHAALATVLLQLEDHAAAVAAAQRSIEHSGESVRMYRVLYEAHRALGNDAEAEQARTTMASLGSGADSAALAYNEGVAALRSGDDETAQARFEEALEVEPDLGPALQGLTALYLRQGDFAAAAPLAERAFHLDPTNETTLRLRWEAYRGLGDEAKTKEAFAALAAANPQAIAEEFYSRGVELFEAGNAEEALQQFQSVIEVDSGYARAHYYLGLCYTSADEGALAKQHLEKFIALAPEDPEAAMAKEMLSYLE